MINETKKEAHNMTLAELKADLIEFEEILADKAQHDRGPGILKVDVDFLKKMIIYTKECINEFRTEAQAT